MRKWMGRIWKNLQIFAPNICFRGAETLGYVVKLCENAIKITPAGGYPGGADISSPEGFRMALICDIIAPSVNAHDRSQFSESTTLFGEAVWCFSLEI